jgi:glucokinase
MTFLGIDLGGHFIKGAMVDNGSIKAREKIPTPAGREPDEISRAISGILDLLDPGKSVETVGVGFPGMLDRKDEKVFQAPNFPLLENCPFRKYLQEKTKRRIILENDANCAAIGEWRSGAAMGLTDFVMLTLGTGIGGGIFSGGRLLRGAYGKAGEMGHLPVADRSASCGCGARGHAEAVFGADALGMSFEKAGIKGNIPDLWLRRKEPGIAEIWDGALDVLARTIAVSIHILDPQAVIIGGGLARAEGLTDAITPMILGYTAPPFRETLEIRLSALGDDAAVTGAAILGEKKAADPPSIP